MDFGKYLRKIREERKITQEEIAKALGYKNNSYIARIERGDFLPSRENLKKIAKVLKVPFKELDSMLFEAKIRELGVKRGDLLALFKDVPYLPEEDKRAIIRAYLEVKKRKQREKKHETHHRKSK